MARLNGTKVEDNRKLLVERIAASRYFSEIHEQQIGHKVFGRARDYDTGSDNIVRVHASMMRKRLEQYFAEDDVAEPRILEIPRRNSSEPKAYRTTDASEIRDGYVAISLVPNLGGNGNVLILSATGGSAFKSAAAYLADEAALAKLRQRLPAANGGAFPFFETLVRVKGRSSQPKDPVVVIARAAR